MSFLPGYDAWLSRPYDGEVPYDEYDEYLRDYWSDVENQYNAHIIDPDMDEEDKCDSPHQFAEEYLDPPLELDEWIADKREDAEYEAGDRKMEEMRDRGEYYG